MLREDPRFYLTNLHSWINGNNFYGSYREMRFFISVHSVVDKVTGEPLPESNVTASVWKGEFCMEESEILASKEFLLTEEGRESVIDWLEEQYKWILTLPVAPVTE